MNAKQKILPTLNDLFIRRSAYETHRRRMRALELRKNTQQPSKEVQSNNEAANNSSKNLEEYKLKSAFEKRVQQIYDVFRKKASVPIQVDHKNIISPFKKKKLLEQQCENHRMLNALLNSESKLAQRYTSEPDFMKHQQIQKRIRKFVQASNRVDYKYERSLRAVAKQKCNSQGIKSLPISMSLEEIDHRRQKTIRNIQPGNNYNSGRSRTSKNTTDLICACNEEDILEINPERIYRLGKQKTLDKVPLEESSTLKQLRSSSTLAKDNKDWLTCQNEIKNKWKLRIEQRKPRNKLEVAIKQFTRITTLQVAKSMVRRKEQHEEKEKRFSGEQMTQFVVIS